MRFFAPCRPPFRRTAVDIRRFAARSHSRRGLGRLLGGLVLASPLIAAGSPASARKNKGKKKCRPSRDNATVATDCFSSGGPASSRANQLGFPFVARRGGKLDRVDVTAKDGPGGAFVIEVRDLDLGQGISSAPVLAAARVTVPPAAQGISRLVTGRFDTGARLVAGDSYGLVIRFLGDGDNQHYFRLDNGGRCLGEGVLLTRSSEQEQFSPIAGLKLEHTVYVVP
jgi:hypothetical protein